MSDNTQKKLLVTYAQIRLGLEKSRSLIATLDAATLGEDGEALKVAMLERYAQQIAQLRYLESRLARRDKG